MLNKPYGELSGFEILELETMHNRVTDALPRSEEVLNILVTKDGDLIFKANMGRLIHTIQVLQARVEELENPEDA